jgi:hypothetical protein
MHLGILPDHQNQVIIKLFFSPLEWLRTCFDAFPDHKNQVLKKLFFSPLEWLKTCFDAFPDHQNQVLKKFFFNVWSGLKCVFMQLRILPDHQNKNIKKLFFSPLKWLKRVLMHFLTTRIKSFKIIFQCLECLKTCFDAFPGHQNQVLKKTFFNV